MSDAMIDEPLEALLAVYPNRSYAEAASDYLLRMERQDSARFDGMAIVVRHHDGTIDGEVVGQNAGKRGGLRGAMAGAAIGLIFPPLMLGATVVGAGIGTVEGRRHGHAKRQDALREWGKRLELGHAGLIVLSSSTDADDIAGQLTGYEELHRLKVDPESLVPLSEKATRKKASKRVDPNRLPGDMS